MLFAQYQVGFAACRTGRTGQTWVPWTLLPREPRGAGGWGTAQWAPHDTDAASQEWSAFPCP